MLNVFNRVDVLFSKNTTWHPSAWCITMLPISRTSISVVKNIIDFLLTDWHQPAVDSHWFLLLWLWQLTPLTRTLTKWPASVTVLSSWLMSSECHRCSGQVAGPVGPSHVMLHSHTVSHHIVSSESEHITHVQNMHRLCTQHPPWSETFELALKPVSIFVLFRCLDYCETDTTKLYFQMNTLKTRGLSKRVRCDWSEKTLGTKWMSRR